MVHVGSSALLFEHPELANDEGFSTDLHLCRKDTGEWSRVRKWSRGYQFVVGGGGHIEAFAPLYQ